MNKMKTLAKWAIPAAMVAMPLLTLAVELNVPTAGEALTLNNIKDIIITIANWLMTIGVVIAVLFLAWGGIKWITAGGDSKKVDDAKAIIKNGFIGLVVLFGIGIILRTASSLITRSFF